jgi:hypothetical protein
VLSGGRSASSRRRGGGIGGELVANIGKMRAIAPLGYRAYWQTELAYYRRLPSAAIERFACVSQIGRTWAGRASCLLGRTQSGIEGPATVVARAAELCGIDYPSLVGHLVTRRLRRQRMEL